MNGIDTLTLAQWWSGNATSVGERERERLVDGDPK